MKKNIFFCLQIWDTAGQERYHSLSVSFYRGADCCVLVYDSNNRVTFDNLDIWYDDFLINAIPHSKFPFVLLANKVDLDNRQVTKEEALQWCKSRNNMSFFETSAKDGTNVEEAFVHMAENHIEQVS
jgi:Ras-related protein Rab-7A